jgi:hypothetical protein
VLLIVSDRLTEVDFKGRELKKPSIKTETNNILMQ